MSDFQVNLVEISALTPIEGADKIELATVYGYQSVVQKGMYQVGDKVFYLPEASLLPAKIVEELNMVGKLPGPDKNRIKAIRLRGCLSQGILLPVKDRRLHLDPEYNYAEELGIQKYEPKVPVEMSGEMVYIGDENTISYDIENYKKYPDVIEIGEEVVVTEKIHGTFCMIGYIPNLNNPEVFHDGNLIISSKGLGAKGMVFKKGERNISNVYCKTVLELETLHQSLTTLKILATAYGEPVFILGEVFGRGVQDLHYSNHTPQFRAFDVYVGKRGQGKYLNYAGFVAFCHELKIETVPMLVMGHFDKDMLEYANGYTTLGREHIREGCVIKPLVNRTDSKMHGRVILKHVSENYLLRDGGTEYN